MPRRCTPRISTFSYRGFHRYSWTICTFRRHRVFVTDEVVTPVRSHFLHASQAERVAVLAYCFMPDHLHLLIEGVQDTSNATAFVNKGKQLSGYWFGQQRGGRLWQRTSWDRVLRRDDDVWMAIRYILGNPVRAGLVESPLEYPFSGSFVHSREELMEALSTDPAG